MSHRALSWSAGPLFGVVQRLVVAPRVSLPGKVYSNSQAVLFVDQTELPCTYLPGRSRGVGEANGQQNTKGGNCLTNLRSVSDPSRTCPHGRDNWPC